MANCAYHPEADVVGTCVSCGQLICAECKTVLGEKIYCNKCADKLFTDTSIPPAQAKEKIHYSRVSRVYRDFFGELGIQDIIGIILGILFILSIDSLKRW